MDDNMKLLNRQLQEHSELMQKYLIENIADVGQAWDEIQVFARWCWCEAMKARGEEHRIGEEKCTVVCAECGKGFSPLLESDR